MVSYPSGSGLFSASRRPKVKIRLIFDKIRGKKNEKSSCIRREVVLDCVRRGKKRMTYWRINDGPMTEADLRRDHESRPWVWDDDEEPTRPGLSVCASLEELARYFAIGDAPGIPGRGANLWGSWLVQLEGEVVGEGFDGEPLIRPTRIISQEPVEDRFLGLVQQQAEEYYGFLCRWDRNDRLQGLFLEEAED